MSEELINKLITLSKIFVEGYTVEIKNNDINQCFKASGYVISIKTLITINPNTKSVKMTVNKNDLDGIIGGWKDTQTGIYYIEKNIIVENLQKALLIALENNQKAIFDLSKSECIDISTYC